MASITAIATAVPDLDFEKDYRRWALSRLGETREARLFERMAHRSGIEHRWSVLGEEDGAHERRRRVDRWLGGEDDARVRRPPGDVRLPGAPATPATEARQVQPAEEQDQADAGHQKEADERGQRGHRTARSALDPGRGHRAAGAAHRATASGSGSAVDL